MKSASTKWFDLAKTKAEKRVMNFVSAVATKTSSIGEQANRE